MHGILKKREKAGRWEDGGIPKNLNCKAVFVQKTHRRRVTSSYHSIHLLAQTPLLRSKCGGVSSPLQMVSFQRATHQGSTQLIGETGWADSWVSVLHKMFCLILLILQGDERQEPPTELLCPPLEGAYLLWTITSCSF